MLIASNVEWDSIYSLFIISLPVSVGKNIKRL